VQPVPRVSDRTAPSSVVQQELWRFDGPGRSCTSGAGLRARSLRRTAYLRLATTETWTWWTVVWERPAGGFPGLTLLPLRRCSA
jgi:hypothetical protein